MEDFLDLDPKNIIKTNKNLIETVKLAFTNIQNYLCLILLEIVTNFDGTIAVLYTLVVTIGIKAVIMLLCCYIFDKIEAFLQKSTGLAPKPQYSITWVDRGWALLASAWTMGELFTYNPAIVRQFFVFRYLDENFLRGIAYFININPLNSTVFGFFIFREVIRRRGPDTKWFGSTTNLWIKNFVRYHWCFAFCLNIVVQTYMYAIYKFLIPQGLSMPQQETIALIGFIVIALIIFYSAMCAILGIRCKVPIFHGACILHVGKLQNEKDDPFE